MITIEHLKQILIAFNNKLEGNCPKSIKTSLSLIGRYKDKLTKHRKGVLQKLL